jgi:hypothetical protein
LRKPDRYPNRLAVFVLEDEELYRIFSKERETRNGSTFHCRGPSLSALLSLAPKSDETLMAPSASFFSTSRVEVNFKG